MFFVKANWNTTRLIKSEDGICAQDLLMVSRNLVSHKFPTKVSTGEDYKPDSLMSLRVKYPFSIWNGTMSLTRVIIIRWAWMQTSSSFVSDHRCVTTEHQNAMVQYTSLYITSSMPTLARHHELSINSKESCALFTLLRLLYRPQTIFLHPQAFHLDLVPHSESGLFLNRTELVFRHISAFWWTYWYRMCVNFDIRHTFRIRSVLTAHVERHL